MEALSLHIGEGSHIHQTWDMFAIFIHVPCSHVLPIVITHEEHSAQKECKRSLECSQDNLKGDGRVNFYLTRNITSCYKFYKLITTNKIVYIEKKLPDSPRFEKVQ